MMGDEKVTNLNQLLTLEVFVDDKVLIKKGKKNYLQLVIR